VQGVEAFRTTQRGSTVFVHVFDWPSDGVIRLPSLRGTANTARFLTEKMPLHVQRDGAGWRIDTGTTHAPDVLNTVIAVEIAD
jgi:alpha-L-fucosidase